MFLTHYPGVLMSEEAFQLFHTFYHCPTALRVPQLDYTEHDGRRVEITLVGDPTALGPMINDGTPAGRPSQLTAQGSLVRWVKRLAGSVPSTSH